MVLFSVEGPFQVPTYDGKVARVIDEDSFSRFWERIEIADDRGCYVFGIRAGRGIKPIYVGRATKTFRQEVFTSHKLWKYQQCLADTKKGIPVMFFVVSPSSRGKPNVKVIKELEDFLIQTAVSKNPDLLNVKGTSKADWGINGVIRGRQGQPSISALALKKSLGL
jgi:hypothetical protein